MSACSTSQTALIPADVRASVTAEDAKSGANKVTVEEILQSARQEDGGDGATTTIPKKRSKLAAFFKRKKRQPDYSPALNPVTEGAKPLKHRNDAITAFLTENEQNQDDQEAAAQTVLTKTSNTETIKSPHISIIEKSTPEQQTHNKLRLASNDYGRAGDGGLTNAEIARNWVETGPEDLAGLPVDGFDENDDFYDDFEEGASKGESADVRFSTYLQKSEARRNSFILQPRRKATPVQEDHVGQDPSTIFNQARRLAIKPEPSPVAPGRSPQNINKRTDPSEILARSKALISSQNANLRENVTNDELIEKARLLAATSGQDHTQATFLFFRVKGNQLSPSQYEKIARFLEHHGGKPILIEAGLSKEGTTFEKLATAQSRITKLVEHSPQLRGAEQKIKPDLEADTIHLSIKTAS